MELRCHLKSLKEPHQGLWAIQVCKSHSGVCRICGMDIQNKWKTTSVGHVWWGLQWQPIIYRSFNIVWHHSVLLPHNNDSPITVVHIQYIPICCTICTSLSQCSWNRCIAIIYMQIQALMKPRTTHPHPQHRCVYGDINTFYQWSH